ncbi:MAG: DUF756 domain-containing protein, partial [Alphaproteobacteria bacterium]|nr:DUF756 domain-containing protein [Alphaproteobacteria bacterium]
TGTVGAFFHVRAAVGAKNSGAGTGPWGYTVDPVTGSVSDSWTPTGGTAYNLSVYGPNGFFRNFAGGLTATSDNLGVQSIYDTVGGGITVEITNLGAATTTVVVVDNYTGNTQRQVLTPGKAFPVTLTNADSLGWYDLLITSSDPSLARQYAGHVETGADSISDPMIGAGA